MFKKSMATALLVCSIPAVASASWFLSTQVKNGGGTLTSRNMTGQSVTDGAIFKSYTATSGALAVTATPATGFTLQSLTVNGTAVTNGTVAITGADQNIAAVFAATGFAATSNGTPSALNNLYYGYELKSPVTFTFAPAPGNAISAINTTDIPVAAANFNNAVITDATKRKITVSTLPGAVNKAATITLPKGYIFTTGFALNATQIPMVATLKAGASHVTSVIGDQYSGTARVSAVVTVPAGGPSYTYNWTYVSGPQNTTVNNTVNGKLSSATGSAYDIVAGPAITLTQNATTGAASFAPTVPGQYKLLLTATPNDGSAVLYAMTTVNAVTSAKAANAGTCQFCHTANNIGGTWNADGTVKQTSYDRIFKNWSGSAHHDVACSKCHLGTETGGHPGTINCNNCHHSATALPVPVSSKAGADVCAHCHASDGQNIHTASDTTKTSCISCHDIAAPQHTVAGVNLVGDNNGVRAIVGEFQKWSHHVSGVNLNDAHCAACHLEGKTDATGTSIVVDPTYHMSSAQVHLRDTTNNADDDFAWDPMAPNHSGMDQFCMSCHDGNGAVSPESVKIQAYINANGLAAAGKTASAKNPFGDTISNRYDKMQRPGVTNVNDQFNTGNNSHHAVKGPRYSGRTRTVGDARAIAGAGLTKVAGAFDNNSSALLQGVRSTIYDAGNFNSLYAPLANAAGETAPRTGAASLGDDSTLHCGDCHTVGQWKPASSVNAAGVATTVAIGAHGSNNEYMLRNSQGTDERHVQRAYLVGDGKIVDPSTGNVIPTGAIVYTNPNAALLVCFNCHNVDNYGQYMPTGLNGANAAGAQVVGRVQSHAGEYAEAGRCNGAGNTISFAGYTTGAATDGTQFESRINGLGAKALGEQNPEFGNIFGIQCLNCHNSGLGNAYGGIHGSANNTSWNGVSPDASVTGGAYIDGMGNTQKVERFLPGLNDVAHVPGVLGGFVGGTTATSVGVPAGKYNAAVAPYPYTTGAISNDTNWEQKGWQQTATTIYNYNTGAVKNTAYAGAGCYTLGDNAVDVNKVSVTNVADGYAAPSVTGETGAATAGLGTWGGCDDHAGAQGTANHGFVKRIVRPITY